MINPTTIKLGVIFLVLIGTASYIAYLNVALSKTKSAYAIQKNENDKLSAILDENKETLSIIETKLSLSNQRYQLLADEKKELEQASRKFEQSLKDKLAKLVSDSSEVVEGECFYLNPELTESFNQ